MLSTRLVFGSCFLIALVYGVYLFYAQNGLSDSLGYFSLAFACLAIGFTPSSLKVDVRHIVEIENRGWLVCTGISVALAFAAHIQSIGSAFAGIGQATINGTIGGAFIGSGASVAASAFGLVGGWAGNIAFDSWQSSTF